MKCKVCGHIDNDGIFCERCKSLVYDSDREYISSSSYRKAYYIVNRLSFALYWVVGLITIAYLIGVFYHFNYWLDNKAEMIKIAAVLSIVCLSMLGIYETTKSRLRKAILNYRKVNAMRAKVAVEVADDVISAPKVTTRVHRKVGTVGAIVDVERKAV